MTAQRIVFIILIIAAVVRSATADGSKQQQVRDHVEVADREFKLGRFAEALVGYQKAYELVPLPPLLFNIGQCHRYLREFEKAVFSFQSYLRESPHASNRATVENLIRELEGDVVKQRAEREQLRVEAARVEVEARDRAEALQRQREAEARQREADDQRKAREQQAETDRARSLAAEAKRREDDKIYKKWWFWSVLGGAAIAAGGTGYYLSGSTTVVPPSGSVGGLDWR